VSERQDTHRIVVVSQKRAPLPVAATHWLSVVQGGTQVCVVRLQGSPPSPQSASLRHSKQEPLYLVSQRFLPPSAAQSLSEAHKTHRWVVVLQA
jgi:hypothetical protein